MAIQELNSQEVQQVAGGISLGTLLGPTNTIIGGLINTLGQLLGPTLSLVVKIVGGLLGGLSLG